MPKSWIKLTYLLYILSPSHQLTGTVSQDFNRPNLVSKCFSNLEKCWIVLMPADLCVRRNEQNSRFAASPKWHLLLCNSGAGGESSSCRPLQSARGQNLFKFRDTVPLTTRPAPAHFVKNCRKCFTVFVYTVTYYCTKELISCIGNYSENKILGPDC